MSLTRLTALVFGLTFVAVGIVGFIPNPLVHAEGIFVTNATHNIVHILTGGVFLSSLFLSGKEHAVTMAIGVGYIAVTILGFLTTGDYMLGLIHINQADRWLHAFLAVVIVLAAIVSQRMELATPPKT